MSAGDAAGDRVTRVALFGVRFTHAGTGAVVSDGLEVRLFRPDFPYDVASAFRARGGHYAVQRLPAMPRHDFGAGDGAFWQQVQAKARPFVVEVRDAFARFHGFSFRVMLPLRDAFRPAARVASASGFPDSVPLFPVPGSPAPASTAAVYADLVDANTGAPLRYALLAVQFGGTRIGLGIADADGKVAAMFPYPKPLRPTGPAQPPDMFAWNVELRVHDGKLAAPAPGRLPDLDDLLAQQDLPASRLVGQVNPQQLLPSARLVMGSPLAVKTAGAVPSALRVLPP